MSSQSRKTTFGLIPDVKFNRSKFTLSHTVKTSMNVGTLYPIDVQEVLPGDSFKTKLTCVTRLTTSFIKPVIDNCYMDIYHFFVPYRLLFDDFERVFGNPNPSAYVNNELLEFPSTDTFSFIEAKTVGDYLGLPLGRIPKGLSILPFRAFARIYNEWFRNENTVDEMYIQMGGIKQSEFPNNFAWSPSNYSGYLPKVGKKKDYFTSCLPSPQKGEPVLLPLTGDAPVNQVKFNGEYYKGLEFTILGNDDPNGTDKVNLYTPSIYNQGGDYSINGHFRAHNINQQAKALMLSDGQLYADLSDVTSANVNDLRLAFQLQKMLERDSLYGSRINEYYRGHFGVENPDARLQFTEFLGGGRIPISVTQVNQTSQSTQDSPLGNVSGYSLSGGTSRYTKGFTEHGYVFTVGCIRTIHTYSQGVPKKFTRIRREQFYDPLFANIGEQPVYRSEIFAESEEEMQGNVFGYNEAWADYRYAPSQITGGLRPRATDSLDVWHFGDKYSNAPVLTSGFTNETSEFFDRTISVPSSSIDNFICDFYFDTKAVRVMPVYSVPGLIDHH